MKIAHITTHLNPGGISTYIETLATALQHENHQSIVISSGGTLESLFREHKIPCFNLALKTKFEFHPKLFGCLPQLISILKREKIDLIHAHTRVAQVISAWIQIFTSIPFVSTCHGTYKPRMGRKLFPAWGEKIFAISPMVRDDLILTHQISNLKIHLVYNGIRLHQFVQASLPENRSCARQKWGIKPHEFAICLVSRIIADKGIEDFLHTIQILKQQNYPIRAFVVGEGEDLSFFKKMASEMKLLDVTTFTGHLVDVSEIFSVCNASVSLVRVTEGFGLSIAEAMAAALPVIATNQWALMEALKPKNIGEFTSIKQPAKVAEILGRWIADPALAIQMGKNGQRVAIELFDVCRVAKEISHTYFEVLKKKKRH